MNSNFGKVLFIIFVVIITVLITNHVNSSFWEKQTIEKVKSTSVISTNNDYMKQMWNNRRETILVLQEKRNNLNKKCIDLGYSEYLLNTGMRLPRCMLFSQKGELIKEVEVNFYN